MQLIKMKRFEVILSIIVEFIDTKRLDVAGIALSKLENLNREFGNEYNHFYVEIKDKSAICLK